MKSVLMSIHSEGCKLIASGEETIEIRKTKPKTDTPFKCYIYCTNGGRLLYKSGYNNEIHLWQIKEYETTRDVLTEHGHQIFNGKIIGEFICDKIFNYEAEFVDDSCQNSIRKFEVDEEDDERIYYFETSNEVNNPDDCKLCKNSCLSFNEIKQYVSNSKEGFFDFYAWHISNLVIYDEPKELSDFYLDCDKFGTEKCNSTCPRFFYDEFWDGYEEYVCPDCNAELHRPPQSWYYVECKLK